MEKLLTNVTSRLPVHVLYGGAHLFKQGLFAKLGQRALDHPSAANAAESVRHKLATEPVEDYRIDFEDGFGLRDELEEQQFATQAGIEFARMAKTGQLPPRIGIRPRADGRRARHTLETFLKYATGGPLPRSFIVTQPKLEKVDEAKRWREMLEKAEFHFSLPALTLRHEIMVEHPSAVRCLAEIAKVCENRLEAAHFGCYDYLSAMNVPAPAQALDHPYAVQARWAMQQVMAPLGIPVSDGAYTKLPVPGDAQSAATAFAGHSAQVLRALNEGYYCGWDLHPAQLVSRFVTLHGYFQSHLPQMLARYRQFQDAKSQALVSGGQFDDAATVEGLLVFLQRGLSCGAFAEKDLQ